MATGEPGPARLPQRDQPWVMRTYAGHTSPTATNALFRRNLAKGQTGLSVAFDLPTQTGYDPDAELARSEVGRVGVPVSHVGDVRALFEGIDLAAANTSMTINATAMWLFALYVTVASERGAPLVRLAGTTQNDIVKEYLSRGTYIFPPGPSLRLTVDLITWAVRHCPRWNPINVCSYHLQEAGATPVQEVAFALATAVAVLDEVRARGQDVADVAGRMSFFVNAGVGFVRETGKLRAFARLWRELLNQRYGISDERSQRFRYGVQVNSLGLTQAQPENNVARIVLEMLGVTLSRDARARAVQLPAWNEALGLPRPWDQQWSLRLQQVLAYESDLLDYGDIFTGSVVMEALTDEISGGAKAELDEIENLGGVIAAVESGYLKTELVTSLARRHRRIESGEDVVVGVNRFVETEPSPLVREAGVAPVERIDPAAEQASVEAVRRWRRDRDGAAVGRALRQLRVDAGDTSINLMPATLACARAGVTTGEWADVLREVFGTYRPPTGLGGQAAATAVGPALASVRERVRDTAARIGRARLRMLVGKPGLDGHSNGAEQIALRARDAGFEVVYQGIRLTPAQIIAAAVAEDVDVIGLSVLSGAHLQTVPVVLAGLREHGCERVPLVVGGIIPSDDAQALRDMGVARIFTPADFEVTGILDEIVTVIRRANGLSG